MVDFGISSRLPDSNRDFEMELQTGRGMERNPALGTGMLPDINIRATKILKAQNAGSFVQCQDERQLRAFN